jgi:hypothetical protein
MNIATETTAPRHGDALDSRVCDVLVSYRRAMGARVWLIDGIPWIKTGASTVMAFPATTVHPITQANLAAVFRTTGALLAQFATDSRTGRLCTLYMLRDKSYSEKNLQRQFGQWLRRGDRQFTFRRLTWGELGEKGADVLASLDTQERKKTVFQPRDWLRACELGENDSRFIVFGCLRATTLAGFAVFLRHSGWCQATDLVCDPGSFAGGVANFLLFHSAHELIHQADCHAVCFGRSSIPAAEGHARFMRHAGIGEESIQVAAAVHPRWSWMSDRRTTAALISRLGSVRRMPRVLKAHLQGLEVACATDVRTLPR